MPELLLALSLLQGVQDEAEQIRKSVLAAQEAGLLKHDFKTYMAMWADDAQIIVCRSERQGKFDVVLERKEIEATRRITLNPDVKPSFTLTHSDVSVKVTGDEAVMYVTSKSVFESGHEIFRERYRLRRTDQGWKAYENRAWVIELKLPGLLTRYTPKVWADADKRVAEKRSEGDLEGELQALGWAYRLREAYDLARRITDAELSTAKDWVRRASTAMIVGEVDDARASFKRALGMDSEVRLPPYWKKD